MTKTDKLIFWGVLILSCVILLFSNVIFAKHGERVIIELDGAPYASYRLSDINTPKRLSVKTEQGAWEIELTNQSVKIVEASCPDQACLGEISKSGELLICLPHRLIVKIEGNGEVDGVAY